MNWLGGTSWKILHGKVNNDTFMKSSVEGKVSIFFVAFVFS